MHSTQAHRSASYLPQIVDVECVCQSVLGNQAQCSICDASCTAISHMCSCVLFQHSAHCGCRRCHLGHRRAGLSCKRCWCWGAGEVCAVPVPRLARCCCKQCVEVPEGWQGQLLRQQLALSVLGAAGVCAAVLSTAGGSAAHPAECLSGPALAQASCKAVAACAQGHGELCPVLVCWGKSEVIGSHE